MYILQVQAETDTVPWCLLVFSHTGPSLPPVPPLFASAALLLEANPARKAKHIVFHDFIPHCLLACIRVETNADMRVFTHVLTTSAVRKIPRSWTGTVVNTANTSVLKTDTTACSYRQPTEAKNLRARCLLPCPGKPYTALHTVIVT